MGVMIDSGEMAGTTGYATRTGLLISSSVSELPTRTSPSSEAALYAAMHAVIRVSDVHGRLVKHRYDIPACR
jgi:hypothetical protein